MAGATMVPPIAAIIGVDQRRHVCNAPPGMTSSKISCASRPKNSAIAMSFTAKRSACETVK
jgi:hypothetical protein